MRVSRTQAEENHQTVINEAGRLFRSHGFDGIGLADLMKAAGLTHGGFYRQFRSKEDLAVQASGRALDQSAEAWSRIVAKAAGNPFAALIRHYLSERHRDRVGEGCAFVALAADAARSGPALRQTFEAGVAAHLDVLDDVSPGKSGKAARDRSIATLSTMVGALLLSRAVDDKALSKRFLDVAAKELIAGWKKQA